MPSVMEKIHIYYVYILTTTNNTVLYTGVTNDLPRRCFEHKQGRIAGFTQKYNVKKLIYYEIFDHIEDAIFREKQIKGYSRIKKENLINSFNPSWSELYVNGVIVKPSTGSLAQ
jgi:putative endonuclease